MHTDIPHATSAVETKIEINRNILVEMLITLGWRDKYVVFAKCPQVGYAETDSYVPV
jgi:hypothetical protein